jgi:hypothetical protein
MGSTPAVSASATALAAVAPASLSFAGDGGIAGAEGPHSAASTRSSTIGRVMRGTPRRTCQQRDAAQRVAAVVSVRTAIGTNDSDSGSSTHRTSSITMELQQFAVAGGLKKQHQHCGCSAVCMCVCVGGCVGIACASRTYAPLQTSVP